MKIYKLFILVLFFGLSSCFIGSKGVDKSKEKQKLVLITTEFGNMKIRLYDETPKHRDNFFKLVEEGFYDSLLFHRVIESFMIQGGDPDSKNAKPKVNLGNGGPGYTVPAEFVTGLFHKKGVIAAARESDNVNPEKASSGSQFYIVQGRVFTEVQLQNMEDGINQQKKQAAFNEFIMKPENADFKETAMELSQNRKMEELDALVNNDQQLQAIFDSVATFKFTDEQKEIYTTVGGAPHLDGGYTVFGEVVEGLDIIDLIASEKTDKNNRPLKDIIMKIQIIEE